MNGKVIALRVQVAAGCRVAVVWEDYKRCCCRPGISKCRESKVKVGTYEVGVKRTTHISGNQESFPIIIIRIGCACTRSNKNEQGYPMMVDTKKWPNSNIRVHPKSRASAVLCACGIEVNGNKENWLSPEIGLRRLAKERAWFVAFLYLWPCCHPYSLPVLPTIWVLYHRTFLDLSTHPSHIILGFSALPWGSYLCPSFRGKNGMRWNVDLLLLLYILLL